MRTLGLSVMCLTATALLAQQPPGRLVDVGGRRMHLLCGGAGSPTVVLEAGASAFAIDWTLVQREVARTTRVCSYDRAGSGWSDAATPATKRPVAADLHALLQAADERAPYVLVGASAGGLYVRQFAADYPSEVVGLVFVDPATETRLFTLFEGRGVEIASLTAEQLRSTIAPRAVVVPRRAPQIGAPFDRLPPELYAQRVALDEKLIASMPDTVPYETVLASAESERASLARLKSLTEQNAHPLGDRPVVVLTRGDDWSQGLFDAQDYVARLSRRSRHATVPGAGHEIHLYAPDAVVQAIAEVVRGASR